MLEDLCQIVIKFCFKLNELSNIIVMKRNKIKIYRTIKAIVSGAYPVIILSTTKDHERTFCSHYPLYLFYVYDVWKYRIIICYQHIWELKINNICRAHSEYIFQQMFLLLGYFELKSFVCFYFTLLTVFPNISFQFTE